MDSELLGTEQKKCKRCEVLQQKYEEQLKLVCQENLCGLLHRHAFANSGKATGKVNIDPILKKGRHANPKSVGSGHNFWH